MLPKPTRILRWPCATRFGRRKPKPEGRYSVAQSPWDRIALNKLRMNQNPRVDTLGYRIPPSGLRMNQNPRVDALARGLFRVLGFGLHEQLSPFDTVTLKQCRDFQLIASRCMMFLLTLNVAANPGNL